jgi:thiamine-monophosphate kinase
MADPGDTDATDGLPEDALIARHFRPLAAGYPGALGLRDDAALIEVAGHEDLVVTTDALIAGVHFLAGDDPADIAFKALAVNVSDLAAKAAKPIAYSLALALPRGTAEAWIAGFAGGLRLAQERFGIGLSGGDTTTSPAGALVISVTAFGSVAKGRMIRRGGARAGDRLYVSGTIGDAALGLKLHVDEAGTRGWPLDTAAREMLVGRYLRPEPRLSLGAALTDAATAAMDVSDGLAIDCVRLCAASGVAARIEAAKVPLSDAARLVLAAQPELLETILTGGDDYEILAAVPPGRAPAFEAAARSAGIPVTPIGALGEGVPALTVLSAGGNPMSLPRLGYNHRL